MRQTTIDRIRRERDVTPIRREDDTPDNVYEDVALPHVRRWLAKYHAANEAQYPTYAARRAGGDALNEMREVWMLERWEYLSAMYGD